MVGDRRGSRGLVTLAAPPAMVTASRAADGDRRGVERVAATRAEPRVGGDRRTAMRTKHVGRFYGSSRCQGSGVRYQGSGSRSGFRFQVPGIRCQVPGVRCQESGIGIRGSGIRVREWDQGPGTRDQRLRDPRAGSGIRKTPDAPALLAVPTRPTRLTRPTDLPAPPDRGTRRALRTRPIRPVVRHRTGPATLNRVTDANNRVMPHYLASLVAAGLTRRERSDG